MKKIFTLVSALFVAGNLMAEDVTLHFPHVDWADVVASQGWWQMNGYSEGENPEWYINVSPNYTDHLDGTYDVSEMYYAKLLHKVATSTETVYFDHGTITLTTSPYECIMTTDVVGTDFNHYVCDAHGFPHYSYYLTGDAELGNWKLKDASYMTRDSLYRVLDAGTYDFKVLINEGSLKNAIGGTRLNTAASTAKVEGSDDETDPITLTLDEKSLVCFSVYENRVTVSAVPDAPIYLKNGDADWVPMSFANAENGFVTTSTWTGSDCQIKFEADAAETTTLKSDSFYFYVWDEENQGWFSTTAPEVGTECTYIYNPIYGSLEVLYKPQSVDGIHSLSTASGSDFNGKFLECGKVIISRDGNRYNAAGIKQ